MDQQGRNTQRSTKKDVQGTRATSLHKAANIRKAVPYDKLVEALSFMYPMGTAMTNQSCRDAKCAITPQAATQAKETRGFTWQE